jgi:DNA-binding NtrC family response regulator
MTKNRVHNRLAHLCPGPTLIIGDVSQKAIHLSLRSANRARRSASVDKELNVLIVSSRIETRKVLQRTLEGLPVNTFCVSRIDHAMEVLPSRSFAIIFCEEHVSDGSYRKLLEITLANSEPNHFVVILCTGEWEEYLEALKLGAAEVLRCPLQSPDVDMVLIHAMREGRENPALHTIA